MKNLSFFLVLLVAACGSDGNKPTPDGPPSSGPDCFMGTPQTHDQLINACVPQTVTRIVKYQDLSALQQALPLLNPDGTLPPPP